MTTQTLNMTQYFIDNLEVTIATMLMLMLYQFNELKNSLLSWQLSMDVSEGNAWF